MNRIEATRGGPLQTGEPVRPDEPDGGDGCFASVTVRLERPQPEAVFAAASSEVRGFWQSGSRWIAHAGIAAEIDRREGFSTMGGVEAKDAFGWVQGRADRLFARRWVSDSGGEPPRCRLHGGFAFDQGSPSVDESGCWEAFPAARFILPVLEVEADERGARLTVTRRFPGDTRGRRAVDELRRRADRLRRQLNELGGSRTAPGALPPAEAIEEPVAAEAWRDSIERILAAIRQGNVRKVVLARPMDVTLGEVPDSAVILAALRTSNPLAHIYLAQFADDQFLVGASPELIGALDGEQLRTMAVGGSTPRGADSEADDRLAGHLLGSAKNRAEHEIVVEDVVAHLGELGIEVEKIPVPALLRLPQIQHLRTELEARVAADTHILSIVRALHPTAAVCGDPRPGALGVLRSEEPVGRGWYAGPVGWFDASGNGEFAPALRSAVCHGSLLRLHAGAGIVEGSRPRAEWDETRVKFQTMLAALQIARVP